VIQARLQNLEHSFTGDATPLQCFLVHTAELAFKQSVVITKLLLLHQTQCVVGQLASGFRAVHSGSVIAPLEIFRGAENGHAKAAADAGASSGISSHTMD